MIKKILAWFLRREYKKYCDMHKCSKCPMDINFKRGNSVCAYALVCESLEKDE